MRATAAPAQASLSLYEIETGSNACASMPSWQWDSSRLTCRQDGDTVASISESAGEVLVRRALGGGPRILVRRAGDGWQISDQPLDPSDRTLHLRDTALLDFLTYGDLAPPSTPWQGIIEVPPGCQLRLGRDQAARVEYAEIKGPANKATVRLRPALEEAIRGCISHCECSIQVELSGGLDSAVVASSLHQTGASRHLRAVHLNHRDLRCADELAYADEAARFLQIPLAVIDGSTALPFTDLHLPTLDSPSLQLCNLAFHRAMRSSGHEFHSLDGHGGDQLFLGDVGRPLLLKAVVRARGLRAGARELRGFANRHRRSYLTSFGNAWRATQLRQADLLRPALPRWVNASRTTMAGVRNRRRRALFGPKGKPTVNALRVAEIRMALAASASALRENLIHPLLTPAAISAAMAVPVDRFAGGSHDRAAVREQFSPHLAPSISERNSKSDYGGAYALGAAAQLERLAELISSGRLSRSGLIDVDTALSSLHGLALGQVDELWPISQLIALELWLASWSY